MNAVALKTFSGKYGRFRKGEDLSGIKDDDYLAHLVRFGLATNGKPSGKTKAVKAEAPVIDPLSAPSPAATSDPSPSPIRVTEFPDGGSTGPAKPWQSSAGDPVVPKPISKSSKGKTSE